MAWIFRYNHTRLHLTTGYLSPTTYEKKWFALKTVQAA